MKEELRNKDDFILRRMEGPNSKRVTLFLGDGHSFIIDSKRSALLGEDHHEIIKRQLQDKFLKTRLNLKEEKKEETMNEGRIGEKKHLLSKKLNRSEEINKFFNETERFEPWARNRLSKNSNYEMEESGGYGELF